MLDACYTDAAVRTAVDLANTWKPIKGRTRSRPWRSSGTSSTPIPQPVWPGSRGTGPRRLTGTDLAEVREVRETVRAVLERATTDAAGTAALINDGLRRSRATPALRHEHDRWWTEVTADSGRCSAHLAATTLSALAAVIATLGPARLGVCAGPNCRGTFVDLSRNGSKQYCTRTCAHRASVAAYRSRNARG